MSGSRRDGEPGVPDPPLESLQRWFQSVISHPDGVAAGEASEEAAAVIGSGQGIAELLTRSESLDAAGRLSVYADAYFTRLIECLGEVFPMMRRLLGTEVFDGFAFEFLQDCPSRSYTLHHLGRGFPEWLERSRSRAEFDAGRSVDPSAPDWPDLLVDLARLEWAIYDVFDGPGVEGRPTLHAGDLAGLAPETWARIRLTLAPCVRLLEFRFPVNDLYSALRNAPDGEDVPMPPAEPSWMALNRREFVVRRHALSQPAFAGLDALARGHPLEEAVETAAAVWPGDDESFASALRGWFDEWASEGFFLGLDDSTAAPTPAAD
jgi:hypothetical protein